MSLPVQLDEGVYESKLTPLGYEQLETADIATANSLQSIPNGAQFALIQCDEEDVRWRDDGTNPTATVGIVLPATKIIWYTGDLTKIKFIRTAANAALNISYYKPAAVER